MGTFLIVLFLLIFVLPRLLVYYAKWKLRQSARRMQEQMADAFKRQAAQEQERRRESRPGGWETPVAKKQYAANEGEYVEYEEVEVTETTVKTDGDTTRTTTTTTDYQRIVDAKWEEIE